MRDLAHVVVGVLIIVYLVAVLVQALCGIFREVWALRQRGKERKDDGG